jgi:hypothetical protein
VRFRTDSFYGSRIGQNNEGAGPERMVPVVRVGKARAEKRRERSPTLNLGGSGKFTGQGKCMVLKDSLIKNYSYHKSIKFSEIFTLIFFKSPLVYPNETGSGILHARSLSKGALC